MKRKAHIYFLLNFQKNMFSQNAEQPNLLPPSNLETEQISCQPTKLNKNLMNKMLNLIISNINTASQLFALWVKF